MPLPEPRENEARPDFMTRCMTNDVAMDEFPDAVQRLAVCAAQYDKT